MVRLELRYVVMFDGQGTGAALKLFQMHWHSLCISGRREWSGVEVHGE